MKPIIIIPTGLGINSHEELAHAFRMAGALIEFVLLNDLIKNPKMMDDYWGLGFPGGFTMGDQLGAGQSVANRIRGSDLRDKLEEKLNDPDFIVYAVCNSLQFLAKLDLMPVPVGTAPNDSGKHETGFWDLAVNPKNDSVWLRLLQSYTEEPIFAPISHGEGRVYIPPEHIQTVRDQNLIALKYVGGHMHNLLRASRGDRYNPNGSVDDIAGLAWKSNLVLFPHFERLLFDYQRPDRHDVINRKGTANNPYEPTHLMFKAAVEFLVKGQ